MSLDVHQGFLVRPRSLTHPHARSLRLPMEPPYDSFVSSYELPPADNWTTGESSTLTLGTAVSRITLDTALLPGSCIELLVERIHRELSR